MEIEGDEEAVSERRCSKGHDQVRHAHPKFQAQRNYVTHIYYYNTTTTLTVL